jgi:hypothetical protein
MNALYYLLMPARLLPIVAGLFLVLSVLAAPAPASALDTPCSASVSPHSSQFNETHDYTFHIDNTSEQEIVWVKVYRPSLNFTIISCEGPWDCTAADSDATYSSASIAASGDEDVVVTASLEDLGDPSTSWTVQVSDQSGGTDPTTCTGSLDTSIPTPSTTPNPNATPTPITVTVTTTTTAADTTGPTVSLNALTESVYSTPPSIPGQAIDSTSVASAEYSLNLTTWYSITLDTKSAKSTTFKFTPSITKSGSYTVRVRARDTAGNYGSTISLSLAIDLTPPSITITTDLSLPFAAAPDILGTASDKYGVDLIEYSSDAGANWQSVQVISHTSTQSNFSFTPAVTEDGDYSIYLRATDTAGNTTSAGSNIYKLIIDRLPPRIGQFILTSGVQILEPRPDGSYAASTNTPLDLYVSIVGGPKIVSLKLNNDSSPIPLAFSSQNRLWHSQFSLPSAGTHALTIEASDPNNSVSVPLVTLTIQDQGYITPPSATITAFVYDENTNKFSAWDASPFGFTNPQKTNNLGRYSLSLPPGKYYLQAKANNYRTKNTSIFILDYPTPITQNFTLSPLPSLKLGPLSLHLPGFLYSLTTTPPTFSSQKSTPSNNQTQILSPLVSTSFPKFKLSIDGKSIDDLSLHQKKTLVSLLPTWCPLTSAQLKSLSAVKLNPNSQIVVFAPQDTEQKAAIISHRLGLNFPYIADPDSELFNKLKLYPTPSHLLLDQRGTIIKIITGQLTEEAISSLLN